MRQTWVLWTGSIFLSFAAAIIVGLAIDAAVLWLIGERQPFFAGWMACSTFEAVRARTRDESRRAAPERAAVIERMAIHLDAIAADYSAQADERRSHQPAVAREFDSKARITTENAEAIRSLATPDTGTGE